MLQTRVIIILLTLLAFSCKDYKVRTIVNEDGSIEKIIQVSTRDKISDMENIFFPIDDSWDITNKKDTLSSQYILTAKKKFNSVTDLIDKYGSPRGVVIEVNMAKKFRWFYTYYEYEEIIEKTNPFNAIKIEDYLSAAEYQELQSGEISDSLSEKMQNYLQESAFEELIIKLTRLLVENKLDTAKLVASKDELTHLFEQDDEEEFIYNKIAEIYLDVDISQLKGSIDKIYSDLEIKAEKIFPTGSEFEYFIEMPGLILSTTANSIEGSTGYWKFNHDNFIYLDYKMSVESRTANLWAMIATGVVVILLLTILLLPALRKTRRTI